MTEELKKQGGVDDAAAAGLVEETAAASTELDDAAKAAEREARRQALYEENERAEDERARAEAERMRDVDDEDEDETPRDTWATVRRLWSEAAGDHWRFYIVFASIVFYVIFNTAAPAYSARVIDELWGHIQVAFVNNATFSITWENCGKTIFVYFMIWTAAASFYALQSFLMSSVAERLNLRLRNRIAQKLNRLPLAYFDAHRPGEVVSRATNDLDKMSESMQRGLLQLLVSIGTVVGAVSVMFVFSVQLTLVFLFFTALSLLVTKVVSRRTHDVTGERQEWVSKITSAVEEGYSGRLVIRAFNRERQSSAEVHEASKELARVSTKADFMINAVGPAVRFIGRLAQIVIALVGCSMLVAGHMTVGVFQAFFQFIYEASEPMTQLSFTFNSLQSALASAERVFDLLDEPEMEADPLPDKAAKLPGRVEGRVSFEHVRFGYSPDKPLMRDVSFTAEPGQKIAVVGTTGAGKTTLINLLMRFYEIDGGRITLEPHGSRRATSAVWHGAARRLAVRWHDCRKHRLRLSRGDARRDRGRRSCRAGRLLCAHHAAGLRHARGQRCREHQPGPASAADHRTRAAQQPGDSHPGRGDLKRGYAYRACHRSCHGRAHARAYEFCDRAPPVDDCGCRPDLGHGSRQHHRARHA